MWGLSTVAASGGHSSSRCAGLSLSRPLLLRSTGSRRAGSVVVAHRLSRSAACGIFPDQGSNPCPLHWQADSQPLHHQGSPKAHIWLPVSPACCPLLVPLPGLWLLSLSSVHKLLKVPWTVFPVSGSASLLFSLPGISCPALVDLANSYSHFRVTQLWLRCDPCTKIPSHLHSPLWCTYSRAMNFTYLQVSLLLRLCGYRPPPPTGTRTSPQRIFSKWGNEGYWPGENAADDPESRSCWNIPETL